jgi:hypothetical protein
VTVTTTQGRRRARTTILVIGVLYLVFGVAGFAYVGWGTFGYEEPVRLFGVFGVSTLLNIVHTFAGLLATVAALRKGATAFAPVALVAFVALTVFGIVARVFGGTGDPLNQTWWNIILYALTALACGYVYALGLRAPSEGRVDND